jgi:hypothetical protein
LERQGRRRFSHFGTLFDRPFRFRTYSGKFELPPMRNVTGKTDRLLCQQSLADLYVIAWLDSLVQQCHGLRSASGLDAVERWISATSIEAHFKGSVPTGSSHVSQPGEDSAGFSHPASSPRGLMTISPTSDFHIGPKTRQFWKNWLQRSSYRTVYACG